MQNKIQAILIKLGFCLKDAECVSRDILDTYGAKGREYHGINHIANMLSEFQNFVLNSDCADAIKNVDEFVFAIVMHDYINGTKQDVSDSAKCAKEFLKRLDKNYDCEYVEKLILATDYENCEQVDFDQQLIQDLDLQKLGADELEYDGNAFKIREEYKKYPDEIFNEKRVQVLKMFLDKDFIFNTKYYRDKYEKIARDNLQREITKLSS